MELGKIYDVVFSTGRYEIEYENGVKCIKKTPQSYRVERADGSTRLIKQDLIWELKEVGVMGLMKDKSLQTYLDIASKVLTEARAELWPSLKHLNEIDSLYATLFEEMGSHIKPPTAAILILNSHACLRSAISLALGGQIMPVFMTLRGCLESALYANAIVANPALANVWVNRDKDEASRDICKSEFAIWKMIRCLSETLNSPYSDVIRDIYDSTIDFGAHPNSKSMLSSLHIDSEKSDTHHHLDFAYIHGPYSFQTRQALIACADIGAHAFVIALACNQHHPRLSELNNQVLALQDQTPGLVKELGLEIA